MKKGGRAMWFNPFLAQRLAEERMKDAQREAEQARLIRTAKSARRVREWPLPVIGRGQERSAGARHPAGAA